MDNITRLLKKYTSQPPSGLAGDRESCAFCDQKGINLETEKYCSCDYGQAKEDDDSRYYEKLDEFEFDD